MSSHSYYHPREVLLAQFSLDVQLKPHDMARTATKRHEMIKHNSMEEVIDIISLPQIPLS